MAAQKTRKVRTDVKKQTKFKPRKPHRSSDLPRTTAKPLHQPKEDLTLSDWLEIIEYVEANPSCKQKEIVDYFATRASGVLRFTQSALSKKLKIRAELRERAKSNPNALSEKRRHVVTRPDVDEALNIWQQDMARKGDSVTGPMLMKKRQRFEELFNVPEEERLEGQGWLTSFKKAYVHQFITS